jgi:hypothetical protein
MQAGRQAPIGLLSFLQKEKQATSNITVKMSFMEHVIPECWYKGRVPTYRLVNIVALDEKSSYFICMCTTV